MSRRWRRREKRSHRVSDKIQLARSENSASSVPSSRPLFLFPPFAPFLLSIARAFCLHLPLAALLVRALVPLPRRLAGARFFPTRSSGILPFLTTALPASPARGCARIRSWKTRSSSVLSSIPPLTFKCQAGRYTSCCRKRCTSSYEISDTRVQ